MKRLFLALATAVATLISAQAENKTYYYYDEDDNFMYGCLRRISPNGQWATGGDEWDETGSMLLRTSDPEHYTHDEHGLMLDVDNNGMAVGAWYESPGGGAKYKRAAIYKDGVWQRLPLPEQILGQSYAVAISADSKTIVGHGMCANDAPDEPGKYFPMVWKLNEDTGAYDLHKLYNNLWLPGTFGFYVEDMTPDGRYACGYQTLDMSDQIAAMIDLETGEYKVFHQLEYKEYEPGFDKLYVDGLLDGFDEWTRFMGVFTYATDRYLVGARATVSDVEPDGSGVIHNRAAVYDLLTGEFTEGSTDYIFMSGIDADNAFTNSGMVLRDGHLESISDMVGANEYIATIYDFDALGQTLVGSIIAMTPWGEKYESPILVALDSPVFAAVESVSVDSEVNVRVDRGVLSVTGAKQVQVYTLGGAQISASAVTALAPGLYIVVADGQSRKVLVK